MHKDYHNHPRLGPGGLKCRCCNPFGIDKGESLKGAKRLLNRYNRRKAKQEMDKEVHE